MRFSKLAGALIVLSLLCATSVFAEEKNLMDQSLTDLLALDVSSVGFFKMDPKKAPGYTTVFDQNFIETHSARTIGELLNAYAPGVSVSNREFGAMVAQRGVMVDSSAKTNILLDGKNLNSRSNFGYMLPLNLPFLGYIDRVEVVNGPGAIVHGSGAINGFVNIVPKNGKDNPGLSITEEYGMTDDLYKTEVSYGHPYDKGDFYFYGAEVKADGWVPNTKGVLNQMGNGAPCYGTQCGGTSGIINAPEYVGQFDPTSFESLVNWNHGNFNLLVDYMDMYYEGPLASPTTLGPSNLNAGMHLETRNHTHALVKPQYTFDISPQESFTVTPSLYALSDVYWNRGAEVAIERKLSSGHNNLSEVEYAFESVYRTERLNKNQIALGVNFSHRDFYDQRSLFHETENADSTTPEERGGMFSWDEWAVFGEDVITVTDKWTTSLGVRFEGVKYGQDQIKDGNYPTGGAPVVNQLDDSKANWAVLPRWANSYQFTDTLTGKLSYQKGFRDPDMANFRLLNATQQGSGIRPESMDSLEANLSKALLNKKLNIDVNVFWNMLKDTIGFNRDASGGYTGNGNMGKPFRMHGCEFIVKYAPRKGTDLLASYNFAAPDHYSKTLFNSTGQGYILPMSEDGETLLGTPYQYFKASIAHSFLKDRKTHEDKAGIELSTRYWFGTNQSALSENSIAGVRQLAAVTLPDYRKARTELDLMLHYNLTKNWIIKFFAKNLTAPLYSKPTNSPIGSGASTYQAPPVGFADRQYYVEVTLKF